MAEKIYRFAAHLLNNQVLIVDIPTPSSPKRTIADIISNPVMLFATARINGLDIEVAFNTAHVVFWDLVAEVKHSGNSYVPPTITKYIKWDDVPGK